MAITLASQARDVSSILIARSIIILIMRFIPLFISWIVISAHFFRQGAIEISFACLVLPFFIFLHKPVIMKGIQWITFALVFLWMKVGVDLITIRLNLGMDYFRLMGIIMGILIFTLWSGMLLDEERSR